jgi:hypothetical protein
MGVDMKLKFKENPLKIRAKKQNNLNKLSNSGNIHARIMNLVTRFG